MRPLHSTLMLSVFLIVGCGESQLDGKPTARVEAPSASEATKPSSEVKAPATKKVAVDKTAVEKTGVEKVAKVSAKTSPAAKVAGGETASTSKVPAVPAAKPDPLENAERELVLDTRRSSVGFVGRKVTKDHEGTFTDFEGKAQLKGYVPKSLEITIQTGSVSTDHPDLTNHLKDPDFFNAAKYPTARFRSTKVRPGAEGAATHTVTGELSMLAVTKRITFPVTIVVTDAGATGLAEFKINRKDFGIVYPGRPDDLIHDEVLLKLNLAFLDKKYAR